MPKKQKFCGPDVRCLVTGEFGGDLHHLITQGNHGSSHPCNLMPLKHELHVECGAIGLVSFANKYPVVWKWLEKHGWEWCESLKTWFPPPEARTVSSKILPRRILS